MSHSIAIKLDFLSGLRSKVASVQHRIEATCPALFQEKLALETEVEAVEKDIKAAAKYVTAANAHTLVGLELQLVYGERSSWDNDALGSLAIKYGIPAVEMEGCKSTQVVWSIRKRAMK